MNELKIELNEVDPQDFFGQQNIHIDKLQRLFSKTQNCSWGTNILAFGEQPVLKEFEKRVDMLIAHFGKFNKLNEEII